MGPLHVRIGSQQGFVPGRGVRQVGDFRILVWLAVPREDQFRIDLALHSSRPLSGELVDAAAVVVVMTRDHHRMMEMLYPEAMHKVRMLKSFERHGRGGDLRDPIGMSHDVYRGIRNEIEAALPGVVAHLEDGIETE